MSVASAFDEDKINIEMSDIDLNEDLDNNDFSVRKPFCNGNKDKKDYDQDTVYSIPVVQGKLKVNKLLFRYKLSVF